MTVLVVGLGGTIAMSGPGVVVPTLSAGQLVDAVPGLTPAALSVHSLRNRPGASLTLDDLLAVLRLIDEHDPAGTVVIQGTDTIEETAYALDLLHAAQSPIVVTGAMRNPTLAGPDGPANILAAVRVAAAPSARGLGCLVVLADEIHAASRVRKIHTMSVAAFASPVGGPVGYVAEGSVHVVQRPAARFTFPPRAYGRPSAAPPAADVPWPPRPASSPGADPVPRLPIPRVGLCTATVGDDGELLPDLAARLDGLVVAGFGVGHVPDTWPPLLAEIAARIPVVLASRIGAGFTATATYGFPGAERDLLDRGLVPAGLLDPYKSRLLLQLALLHGASRAQLAAAFGAAGGLDPDQRWPWPAPDRVGTESS